jgi:hypothetical protein
VSAPRYALLALGATCVALAFYWCLWLIVPPFRLALVGASAKALALSACDTIPSLAPPVCHSTVERRSRECAKLLVGGSPWNPKPSNSRGYMACLGFSEFKPEEPQVELTSCEGARLRAKVLVAVAKEAPWVGASAHLVGKTTWFVSDTPVITSADLVGAQLMRQGKQLTIELRMNPAGAARFAQVTGANVGGYLLLSANGNEQVPLVNEPITGGKVWIHVREGTTADELCAPAP